jgi:hypothetical protein
MTNLSASTGLLFVGLVLAACLNTTDKEKNQAALKQDSAAQGLPQDTTTHELTSITWLDSTKDLGMLREGQAAKISYRFKNSGSRPLFIEQVQPGCGCTVVDYPKRAIPPGEEGEILASFDTRGKAGPQTKSMTVYTNTLIGNYSLWFNAVVQREK